MNYWEAFWHVGTFIGMLARKNEKLARFCHVGRQVSWHLNHAGMQARSHVDHVGTQERMARDLGNSS